MRFAAGVVAAVMLTAASGALAAEPTAAVAEEPSPARIRAAAEEYDRGRRAFLVEDFEAAAVHFENAFRDAPRAETLRLAIRARLKAKQLSRAATLAAIGEQRYASDPGTALLVKETFDEALPAVHAVEVTCAAPCALAIDGRVASQADALAHRIFLDPGPRDVGVSFTQGGTASRHLEARRGGSERITFELPKPVAPASTRADPRRTPAKPLGPGVFWIGAGLTALAGAATVISGIDATNNPGTDAVKRDCAGRDASCPTYQEGQSAELRTNVLLGATIGSAVITGVVGLLFTRWGGEPPPVSASAGPLPGGAAFSASLRY